MPLHITTHPLIAHKMTILRDTKTDPQEFRKVMKEITFYLGYEATRSIKTVDIEIDTPLMAATGKKIAENVALIPILRAGLGMCDAMLELLPKAAVHHIGMYRSRSSRLPIQYYNRLPKSHASDVAFILDPCVATSDTLQAVCSIIEKWGAKRVVVICVLGARSGLEKLLAKHPTLEVFVAAVDEALSEEGMILPGFGDAGDRLFCTPFDQHNLSASMSADNLDCLSIAATADGYGNDLKRPRPEG